MGAPGKVLFSLKVTDVMESVSNIHDGLTSRPTVCWQILARLFNRADIAIDQKCKGKLILICGLTHIFRYHLIA